MFQGLHGVFGTVLGEFQGLGTMSLFTALGLGILSVQALLFPTV